MQYLHIRNLEKFNPNYKDRSLIWCKVYFSMVNANPEFEMVEEVDKWRFIAFIMLEIQSKKPTILSKPYLTRKGFDFRRWSLEKTLKSLADFTEVVDINNVTYLSKECNATVTQSRVDKSRVDKSIYIYDFESLWTKYPSKVGKADALRHFKATVKTVKDYQDIQTALNKYLKTGRVINGYIFNGDKWFKNWRDYINFEEAPQDGDTPALKKMRELTGEE